MSKPLWALWTGGVAANREATVHNVHSGAKSIALVAVAEYLPTLTTGQSFRIRAARVSGAHRIDTKPRL